MSTLGLEFTTGRCGDGYAVEQHPRFCQCDQVSAAKVAGIARANAGAGSQVKAKVDAAIRRLAATGRTFSTNDMRVELEGIPGPVVGGRFTMAQKAGVIHFTGERVRSNLASTNGHEVKCWRGVAA